MFLLNIRCHTKHIWLKDVLNISTESSFENKAMKRDTITTIMSRKHQQEQNPAQYSLPLLSPSIPLFSSSETLDHHHNWTWTLNQSPGRGMFRYQAFHMTLLTPSCYALLHPDSIKNGLTALFRDWRPFCGWARCSTMWLMGSPGGLSRVSLKNKVCTSEEESPVCRCTLASSNWTFKMSDANKTQLFVERGCF